MQRSGLISRCFSKSRIPLCVVGLMLTVAAVARSQEDRSTHIFRLRATPVNDVVEALRELVPEDAVVTAEPISNSIIVSAPENTVRQIESVIEQVDIPPEPKLFRLLALNNRLAGETAELLTAILNDALGVGDVNIVADERANALLVQATDEQFEFIQQVLRAIDTEPPTMAVKVFQLQHADADEAGAAIGEMFSNQAALSDTNAATQLRVAVDERTNSVIATGQADTLSVVEALLMQLDGGDVRGGTAELESLRIRIVWVVNGDDWSGEGDRQPRLGAMPDDLADVAIELNSLGISTPRIATQMIVNTSGEFSINGSARLADAIQVDVRGIVSTRTARSALQPSLDITIAAVNASNFNQSPDVRTLCELETTLEVPLGHVVVLGVSPIDGRNSAFVVQVQKR